MSSFQRDGWHTVTPRIITSEPEEMIRFVKEVFRGKGEFQIDRPAEIRISDSLIMISDGGGLREPMPAFLYVYVEDVDETYRRAVKAGAETLELPSDLPYGDRRAIVKDAWGNLWQIASHKYGNRKWIVCGRVKGNSDVTRLCKGCQPLVPNLVLHSRNGLVCQIYGEPSMSRLS